MSRPNHITDESDYVPQLLAEFFDEAYEAILKAQSDLSITTGHFTDEQADELDSLT